VELGKPPTTADGADLYSQSKFSVARLRTRGFEKPADPTLACGESTVLLEGTSGGAFAVSGCWIGGIWAFVQ